MKGVQASGEVPEESLDDVVSKLGLELLRNSFETLQARKSA
jgi:hypothetical protein